MSEDYLIESTLNSYRCIEKITLNQCPDCNQSPNEKALDLDM